MKRINIMTSCDNNLAQMILPQIASIGVNLAEYEVHFYVFHYRITAENIETIKNYTNTFENMTFHEVTMQNLDMFKKLTKYGGAFPPEAYAYLHCHNQLEIDRILYIDAGDVIIHGDISEYYFSDFDGKSFIVNPQRFATIEADGTRRMLNKNDLINPKHMQIIRESYVSSGFIILNLNKLRANTNDLFAHYFSCIKNLRSMKLPPIQGRENAAYLGDQGILGIAFFDDMKFFAYEEVIKTSINDFSVVAVDSEKAEQYLFLTYCPYNFIQALYNNDTAFFMYAPVVLHYGSPCPKPWNGTFTIEDAEKTNGKKSGVKSHRVVEMHNIWREYWKMTPLNKEFSRDSKIKRDNSLVTFNPILFKIENCLRKKDHANAKKYIDAGLHQINNSNIVHYVFTSVQIRFNMTNENDPKRFKNAIELADLYISRINKPEYLSIDIYSCKGYCHFQLGEYAAAAEAYQKSYELMDAYIKGELGICVDLLFLNQSLPNCSKAKLFYIQEIANCYSKLGEFDIAFSWLERVQLSNSDDVKNYFRLINESGNIGRIKTLFERITKMQENADKCFASFNEIVLPNANAAQIIAPFFDEYKKFANKLQGKY